MLVSPRVFLITVPESLPNEGQVINKLLSRSKCVLHLRKLHASLEAYSSLLDDIDRRHHHRVMLHSHHLLARDYGVMGIHTPAWMRMQASQTTSTWDSRSISSSDPLSNLCASTSLHSLDEVRNGDWSLNDYVLLSPIFDSLSKGGYKSAGFDSEALSSALDRARPLRVVALGGITPDRVETAARLGFQGIAVIGAVWQSGMGPEAALDQLEQVCSSQEWKE